MPFDENGSSKFVLEFVEKTVLEVFVQRHKKIQSMEREKKSKESFCTFKNLRQLASNLVKSRLHVEVMVSSMGIHRQVVRH